MIDAIVRALQAVWRFLVDGVTSAARGLMNGLVTDLPVFDDTSLEPFAQWLSVINQWVPFDAAVASLGAYWVFAGSVPVYKFLFKIVQLIRG